MLGNWSLGDYFKKESIEYSFEFLTKVLNIPIERLAVTVFKGNDVLEEDIESENYWLSHGIKQERIGASAVILSPIASQERPQYRGLEEVTREEDTYLRIFGKPFTRVNRRMGVVLCYAPLGSDLDALRDKTKRIAEKVEVF